MARQVGAPVGAGMSAEDLPPRWYVVDRDGLATLCASERDALHVADDARLQWPQRGPYRAVLMGDVAQERERCAAIVQANADACLTDLLRNVLASNAAAIRAQDQG